MSTNNFKETPRIRANNKAKVYGIGVNDSPYVVQYLEEGKTITCPYFTRWKRMLERCYSPNSISEYQTYTKTKVCDEWLIFTNFRNWMITQQWEGNHLDKDIIGDGTLYSPETCKFIPQSLNNLLMLNQASRGIYPVGVSYITRERKYRASICINSVRKDIGMYKTVEEAVFNYIRVKKEHLLSVANLQTDIDLKNGLIKFANSITVDS